MLLFIIIGRSRPVRDWPPQARARAEPPAFTSTSPPPAPGPTAPRQRAAPCAFAELRNRRSTDDGWRMTPTDAQARGLARSDPGCWARDAQCVC
ncbi:hypothetical protein CALCODRAFT_492468 [Calocera cornea HHB12733]|uniref:Uncharacterized protein n=1 Tax=Calocera cornea HHB12733 TaxID=1353952 RepID=A0A165IDG6_9BASI|nr:hypothetical protein CALCODRAFT_492468 [Calocera cornea HHB12733]